MRRNNIIIMKMTILMKSNIIMKVIMTMILMCNDNMKVMCNEDING